MGTTNIQLAKMIKGHNFHGVYSRDELPEKLRVGGVIMNLDTEAGHKDATSDRGSSVRDRGNTVNGSHWVSIYCFPDHTLMYYDPFGFSAPEYLILRWRKQYKRLYYNTAIMEKFSQTNCGQLSVAFLKHAEKGLNAVREWIAQNQYVSYE